MPDNPRMKQVKRTALLPVGPEPLFALINDVARYPEFLPGCIGAEVLSHDEGGMLARLQVKRSLFHGSFTTRNRLEPPHTVHMDLVEGPFRRLRGTWHLQPVLAPSGQALGTRVELRVEFELPAALQLLLGPVLEPAVTAVMDAFVRRATATPAGA
ncbi:MAG: hypothetical protein RL026_2754 [Pseudomonadota bacterium]|jgi:ribosome-associated toxin RatA of RatAB toxin-antitoxin module